MRKQTTFRHSTNIRQDERITQLIADHGPAGYGVYWMIIEILHSHEDMQAPYDAKTIRRMAAQTGMKHEEFHNLLQDMIVDYDLFEIADDQPNIGQQGFIRSTIIYRKPRKPRQTTETINIKEIEDTNIPVATDGQEALPAVVKQEQDGNCPPAADFAAGDGQQNSNGASPLQHRKRSLTSP